jgi:hypothetical protein
LVGNFFHGEKKLEKAETSDGFFHTARENNYARKMEKAFQWIMFITDSSKSAEGSVQLYSDFS